jgi:cell division initiation protein
MSYAPVEIRHVRLRRGLLGYRRKAVDRLLTEVTESFETVWRERADLADAIEQLEGDLVRYRELETLLRTTLVSAERAGHELKAQAKREAELIVEEARAEARTTSRDARVERDHLVGEARRVRMLLHAALDALDEAQPEEEEEDGDKAEAA